MFKNIEELKNRIINYLKDIMKNENNKNAIELINKSGYLAAEAQGEIKIYTDREKTKSGSLHLVYCEISGADGRENNRYAKQFIKDNTIQSLLAAAAEEIEKDKLKLKEAEENKHLLVDLQDKINNYFNSLSIEIENVNISFSNHNLNYDIRFSDSIGDQYFNIYFKLQGNQYLYNDTYKEEKHIFKNVEETLSHFINEISPAIQKKISFLKMYSIIENNFKNNIDKKILFKNKDSFYTAIIDNQYITLYEVNRKKEKPIYNYLYLNQFIDSFIKDNIDRFIIIDNNTDLSVKNLRSLTSSNNNCIMIHEEAETGKEENKINVLTNNKEINNEDIKDYIEELKFLVKKHNGEELDLDGSEVRIFSNNKICQYSDICTSRKLNHKELKKLYDSIFNNFSDLKINVLTYNFEYEPPKVAIKEEFYSNNKEVEPVAPVEDIKNLKIIYNAIESKINNYIELVDDIEYFNDLIDGIVIYFPTGEAYQIFIDIKNQVNNNNSFIVLDENIMILYNSNDINYIIENVIKSVKEKNDYINNNSDKYMTL